MHPKLRLVLTDPIILVLSVLFILLLYHVLDQRHDSQPTPADIIDRLSRGERIDVPAGDGTTVPIEAPRDENGKPIDLKRFLDASGPILEKKLQEQEQAFGADDPRTVVARNGVAATLEYRGEHARAKALLQKNYEIATHAADMPAEARLKALQAYAEMATEAGSAERLTAYQAILPQVINYAAEAPEQASAILAGMANEQLQMGQLDQAESNARLSLTMTKARDQRIQSQFFLTSILFRKHDYAGVRKNAEEMLVNLRTPPDSPQDRLVAHFIAKMYAEMGDSDRAEEIEREFAPQ